MSGFTAAYLSRVEVWILLAALIQGNLAWLSWRCWSSVTANAAPRVRHRVAVAHFASLLLAPIASALTLHGAAVHLATDEAAASGLTGSWVLRTYEACVRVAPALALVWAAGAGVMLVVVLAQAVRLRAVPDWPAPAALRDRVSDLARRSLSGAGPTVRAAAVRAPQVTGLKRPVLIVPTGLDVRLTVAEQDAVLLHELAHLQRGDFGWNLVQRLALALVWFQPAAWRLYREVARERETCCDAFAVEQGAAPVALARALVRLAEMPSSPGLAMGLSHQGDLAVRVERLLSPGRQRQSSWRGVAVAGLVTLAGVWAIGVGRLARVDPALGDLSRASLLGPTISISAHDPKGPFLVRVRRGRVIAAAVGAGPLTGAGIVQKGPRVTLLQPGRREPLLSLIVSPGGRIRWEPRS